MPSDGEIGWRQPRRQPGRHRNDRAPESEVAELERGEIEIGAELFGQHDDRGRTCGGRVIFEVDGVAQDLAGRGQIVLAETGRWFAQNDRSGIVLGGTRRHIVMRNPCLDDNDRRGPRRRKRHGDVPTMRQREVIAMHGVLMKRVDVLMGCTENSEEELELRTVDDALKAYKSRRSPLGRDPHMWHGKG